MFAGNSDRKIFTPILMGVAFGLVVVAGCGGDAEVQIARPPSGTMSPTVVVDTPTPVAEMAVQGQVLLPSQAVASRSLLQRFAGILVSSVEAITAGNVEAVGEGVAIRLIRLRAADISGNGTIDGGELLATAQTDADGRYSFSEADLPTGVGINTCRLLLQVDEGGSATRAFISEDQVDVSFESEAVVRLILETIAAGDAELCDFSSSDISNLYGTVGDVDATIQGTTPAEVNAAATAVARSDSSVQDALQAAIPVPATPTIDTSTATPLPPATATRTNTTTRTTPPTRTPTDTAAPINTATRTNTVRPATFTPTGTPTTTATATFTPSGTPTTTATATFTSAPTNTNTAVPTNTNTPAPTNTNTTAPTNTNTPEPTAAATSTATFVPTATMATTATATVPPTGTPPTATATDTAAPPTDTPTIAPPTDTVTMAPATNTPVPPTSTNTPAATNTNTQVPTSTNSPTFTTTQTPTETPTRTFTPTRTHTPLPPTATFTPTQPAGQQCVLDSPASQLFLQLGGTAVQIRPAGIIDFACGAPGAGGQADCTCNLDFFDPINLLGIGDVCFAPAGPCPAGTANCNGGAPAGIEFRGDHNIGTCTSQGSCVSTCDTYCSGLGAAFVQADSSCEGFCAGGTNVDAACTEDATCPGGNCPGKEPGPGGTGGPHAGVCNCNCIARDVGAVAPAGSMSCQLGIAITIERDQDLICGNSPPSITLTPLCSTLTTSTADAFTLRSNNGTENTDRLPPRPNGRPCSNCILEQEGTSKTCANFQAGNLTGMSLVAYLQFYDSSLGDILAQQRFTCQ